MNKVKEYIRNHPIATQFILCLVVGFILGVIWGIYNSLKTMLVYKENIFEIVGTFFASILVLMVVFAILIYPIVVTIYEVIYLLCTLVGHKMKEYKILSFFVSMMDDIDHIVAVIYDLFIIFWGAILEIIVLSLIHDVMFEAQWFQELRNSELHTPISKEGAITFIVLLSMFAVGMLVIMIIPSSKRAPLITVLSISSMYIGVIEAVLFTVQIAGMNIKGETGIPSYKFTFDLLFTFLIPLNMILILIRTMVSEIRAFNIDENHMSKVDSVPLLGFCNKMLSDAKKWPVIAIVAMIPLLTCIIVVLVLFGQAPDGAIKAFTETANYTFSTKIPPQNVFYDEHYLCTVAAGGHKRIVKPIRMGKRHGHDVVVNRQLLIANAFEQILEEKTPRFHKKVRNFYDKYGFPISKLIKSKIAADIIWFIMKPLEWIFLMVIYFVDSNPEDRIASQYL